MKIITKIRDKAYLHRQYLHKEKKQLNNYAVLLEEEKKTNKRFNIIFRRDHLILNEGTATTPFDRHYVYHTSWAFRKILQIQPKEIMDISSSMYFIGMISSLYKTNYYDFRPPVISLDNLQVNKTDIKNMMLPDNSVECLSCMHVVEHIGLGRYEDEVDYDGDIKAINEIVRVVGSGGDILFVVPVGGDPVIDFNRHRIYTNEMILNYFHSCKLIEFCLIPDNEKDGGLIVNPDKNLLNKQTYGCGCYWFKK
jgi:hypothetical protein